VGKNKNKNAAERHSNGEQAENTNTNFLVIAGSAVAITATAMFTLPEVVENWDHWWMQITIWLFGISVSFWVYAVLHVIARWNNSKSICLAVLALLFFSSAMIAAYSGGKMPTLAINTKFRFFVPVVLSIVTAVSWFRAIRRPDLVLAVPTIGPSIATARPIESGASKPKVAYDKLAIPESFETIIPNSVPKQLVISKMQFAAVDIGNNYVGLSMDATGNSAAFQIISGLKGGLSVCFRGGTAVLNGVTTNGERSTKIANNVTECPPGWDANQDETSTEIVDEKRRPVFQITTMAAGRGVTLAIVGGAFDIGNGMIEVVVPRKEIVCGTPGQVSSAFSELRPIFKYPSDLFPGKRPHTQYYPIISEVAKEVSPYAGQIIYINASPNDPEAEGVAEDFRQAFLEQKWVAARVAIRIQTNHQFPKVMVALCPDDRPGQPSFTAAFALIKALKKNGFMPEQIQDSVANYSGLAGGIVYLQVGAADSPADTGVPKSR
jgi:hypothetical protein